MADASSRDAERTRWEEIKVAGDQLVQTVRKVVAEGNARRIVVKNTEGQTLMELPLTVGVVGAVLLPVWAALGAVAALVKGFTILVEKVDRAAPGGDKTSG